MVKKFVMQWHLSEMCNLKCLHCYQENHKPVQLRIDQLLDILNQYRSLLKKLNMKGHINLTGGEPLCCPYFFNILDEFKKDINLYSFSILTNGTLINEELAKKISEYNPEYVQVSLEGGKKTNDYVRGTNVYNRVKRAIYHLKKNNIFVSLSFTATKLNYKEFPLVVKFAVKNRVDNVWSDRYIPFGNIYDKDFLLSKSETEEYLKIMSRERKKLINNKIKTTIAMYRALQFQYSNDFPYRCTAGDTLLTVMENGDLVPCRRMPIVVGNLLHDNMYDLYISNEILKDLQRKDIPNECDSCEHSELCRGGLKCLTYAIKKDYHYKDVGCNYN